MRTSERKQIIKGIAVCNPVDIDKDYLLFTVDYAAEMGFNHMQIVGPIHDAVKGNVDGMTLYRKYSMFNDEKDLPYVKHAVEAVNEACVKTISHGIKTYVWHHELELPSAFKEVYPEVLNNCGDIEVTHPLVKDFLEHKIIDFFYAYPNIDGIILTLHETKIPLLKLKDQKLGKIERVKYVTQILFDTCKGLGKELIVRPFASLEEDYVMMAKAYEEISTDLLVMDKWTQFDWSLTMPHNAFYHKIKNNPLFVEGDIFGEFFGKGRLPLMLKEHIAGKFNYCEDFSPRGYVARIDRTGQDPFGDVNEVNIHIMHAHLNQKDVNKEIDAFFREKYPVAWAEVRALMEQTEAVLKKIFYAKGYYFTELSLFPGLNHCKNHYYFEMMRENCDIASNEWYIPRDWERGTLEDLLAEKETAASEAAELLECLTELKDRLAEEEYDKLWVKFCNLKLVAEIWLVLNRTFMDYAKYFETRDDKYVDTLEENITKLLDVNRYGAELLGDKFYLLSISEYFTSGGSIEAFAEEIRESFRLEREAVERIEQEKVLDYVICGGAMEGHRLQKEVNFSDTFVRDGALCRIPGNKRGMEWSSINAHGWFSYEVKVKPYHENAFEILMDSSDEELEVGIIIGENEYLIHKKIVGRTPILISYTENQGNTSARIHFNKVSSYTPFVYEIKVKL